MSAATRALHAAASKLSLDGMRSALEAGAKCNDDLLLFARLRPELEVQQVAVLQLLSSYGDLGNAALTYGMWLLEAGVDANAMDGGDPWLHVALRADVVRVLLAAGASVEACAAYGAVTALHRHMLCEAPSDAPAIVRMLVEAGADVHAIRKGGETPPDYAVRAAVPFRVAVSLALEVGSDPAAGRGKGKSELEYVLLRAAPRALALPLGKGRLLSSSRGASHRVCGRVAPAQAHAARRPRQVRPSRSCRLAPRGCGWRWQRRVLLLRSCRQRVNGQRNHHS